jgi:site-specific recombinase XerD
VNGKLHRVALATSDRRVAEAKANAVVRREERRSAGLLDGPEDQIQRPLPEHVADFKAMLQSRGCSRAHLTDRLSCLDEFVEETKTATLRDVDASRAAKWLNNLKARGLSARSVNRRLQAIRQFARFLLTERRLGHDPFTTLKPLNEAADRRHVRRALTPDEMRRLLAAAARRPLDEATKNRVLKGVTPRERLKLLAVGRARALVYDVAAGTGLRRGELTRLRWRDVKFDLKWVRVPAASAKSRRDQSVPLRSDLAVSLAAYKPKDAGAADRVFPPGVFPNLRTFKFDLVAAGIATVTVDDDGEEHFDLKDDSDRSLDFHCLRVTFVSTLVANGVHPRVTQALARHAKMETTMAVYTDLQSLDLHGAVEGTRPAASVESRARAQS